jgi:ankyrin repeat protein
MDVFNAAMQRYPEGIEQLL